MDKDFVCIECFDDGWDEGLDGEWFRYAPPEYYLSCGHSAFEVEPKFCPECGRQVRKCYDCEFDWLDCE